jgi:ATP-dependent DNA helicase RecQ
LAFQPYLRALSLPLSVLKKYWKYSSFRPLQEEIIRSVLDGKDTFVLLPTGGGKSICYQVPALMLPGFCLVISPLIALMHDQVKRLKTMNIPAIYFHASQSRSEVSLELENLRNGKYKIAYISPERLQSQIFKDQLPNMNISFMAVDEAHCISQWGHDFRPSYLEIKSIREVKAEMQFLALTASATPKVQKDIHEQLELKDSVKFQDTFNRPNLSYRVKYTENKREELLTTCRKSSGSGIIYAGSRAKVAELTTWLKQEGIDCNYYHAGLSSEKRKLRQEQWLNGEFPVIICTNAFGMGIDKPDVRFVIHNSPPGSLEAYYQEAGRAGRDGNKAICLLLYDEQDLKRDRIHLATQYPSLKQIQHLYESLCNYLNLAIFSGKGSSFDFDLQEFCKKFDFRPMEAHYSLLNLEALGYITLAEGGILSSGVKVHMNSTAIYDFQLRYERFEPIIKLLLRTYGGIYERYAQVSEKLIASKLNLSSTQVKKDLTELNNLKVLAYVPRSDKPLVTFVLERVKEVKDQDGRLTRLSREAQKRMEGVHHYIESEICRVKEICAYFGEKISDNCESCDVCLSRKRNRFSSKTFKAISDKVETVLSGQASLLSKILNQVEGDEDEIKMVVRWLLEDGAIGIDAQRKLFWKR